LASKGVLETPKKLQNSTKSGKYCNNGNIRQRYKDIAHLEKKFNFLFTILDELAARTKWAATNLTVAS
jgi:hypothetical protein